MFLRDFNDHGPMAPRRHGSMSAWPHGSMAPLFLKNILGRVFNRARSGFKYNLLKVAMQTAEKERIAKDFYNGLSPHERRDHFVLSQRYRSAYNRILDSEDRTTLPRYFWKKWLPILGAEAAVLYVVLRDISRVEAAGKDSWCWPDQEELARRIGIAKNTLRKRLVTLEQYGFIHQERRRKKQGWGKVQSTNDYQVFLDVPVTPKDAVELLLVQVSEEALGPEFKACTQGSAPVDISLSSSPALSVPEFKPRTQGDQRNQAVSPPEFTSCAPNVRNVINVTNVSDGRVGLKAHPAVRAM